ncbi:unnamed protein product [Trichobilharzia szidati]|nr:unnamed protein product [Trichobilharzia szidati]
MKNKFQILILIFVIISYVQCGGSTPKMIAYREVTPIVEVTEPPATEATFLRQVYNAFTTALVLKVEEYSANLLGTSAVAKLIHSLLFKE